LRFTSLDCRSQSVIGHAGRHPYVDDRNVGPMLRHGLQEARSILDSGNYVAVDFGQEPDEALPKQHGIIRYDHAHALTLPHSPTCQTLSGL
jgi:hypothetical protein